MKKVITFILEIAKLVAISLLVVIPIRYFLFQPFLVRGISMEPTFQNNDYLIVERLSYRFRNPQRGEVVVFKNPVSDGEIHIKRIAGLPGEIIEIEIDDRGIIVFSNVQSGTIRDFNKKDYLLPPVRSPGNFRIFLEQDEYFLLGDNRLFSIDSRDWGGLPKENIIGRAFIRAWPFTIIEAEDIDIEKIQLDKRL